MSEPKPFASLSSGLLARKGMAKPAMRPQGFAHVATDIDDLGWNDMGHLGGHDLGPRPGAPAEHVPSSIAALTPAPRAPAEEPAVLEQQRKLEASFAEEAKVDHEPAAIVPEPQVVALPKRKRQPRTDGIRAKDKAAFTLRLDAERHLKLRLACAVMGRSAQQIVTDALDDLLEKLPEINTLAQHVPAKARNKGA
ncbi:hypothetical protein [Sphingosinicella rhizophila]|uniref:Uncharacterized protein n=1 Tax=Sphingosinicella rhizophila TaxID=3050082 RepID=A0ABU3Q318_9SPHN|nr:hypothetical protein [Sphingosinicella sp. GR2756]MDT9597803.1 hypothetical protein [Sphingosinicella sp. GR2756]